MDFRIGKKMEGKLALKHEGKPPALICVKAGGVDDA
jgi:hypothetical protein